MPRSNPFLLLVRPAYRRPPRLEGLGLPSLLKLFGDFTRPKNPAALSPSHKDSSLFFPLSVCPRGIIHPTVTIFFLLLRYSRNVRASLYVFLRFLIAEQAPTSRSVVSHA